MPKPRFDPSQPFEVVDAPAGKPKFDPTQPFEAVDAAPARPLKKTMLEKAGEALWDTTQAPVGYGIPILGPALGKASDAVLAAGSTAIDVAGDALSDRPMKKPTDYLDMGVKNYQERQDFTDARQAKFAKKHPVMAGVKGFAEGMMLPTGAATGMTPVLKAAEGASKLSKVGTFLGNAGINIGENMAVAGADAAMRGQDGTDAAKTAGWATGAVEGVKGGLMLGGKFVPRFVFGVRGDTAAKYKARAPQINAESMEGVTEGLSGAISKVKGDADDVMSRAAQGLDDKLNEFRKTISGKSSYAYNVLDESDAMIKTSKLSSFITKRINELKVGGAVPDNEATKILNYYKRFLDDTGKTHLNALEVKKFLRMIDDDVATIYEKGRSVGGYLDAGDRASLAYRKSVDTTLKRAVREYKKAMKPIAADTRAMEEARKHFRGGDQTRAALERSIKPGRTDAADALFNFEARAGGNVTPDLQRYQELKGLTKGLSEDSAQAKIKQLMGTRNPIALKGKISKLGEAVGEDFIQRIDDLAVKEALEKGFTHGSRNVNLGAFSLSGIAGMLSRKLGGMDDAAKGAAQALGAAVGAMADIVGPQTYKRWMDLAMRPEFAQYERALSEAMKRGPRSVATAHAVLMKKDPEYRRLLEETP